MRTILLPKYRVSHVEVHFDMCEISVTWYRGYETFFMLNSTKHEICSACKYQNANKLKVLGGDPGFLERRFIYIQVWGSLY